MLMSLKAIRINKGLTQKEAAKLLEISPTKLHRWEHAITLPRVEEIKRIETVYDVNYNDISFGV